MWIPALVIVLVIALAVGPVMWFRSTPYQQQIINTRSRATKLGLRVQLVPLSELGVAGEDAKGDFVAAYGLPWVQRESDESEVIGRPASYSWRLMRQRISHEAHFEGWWDWQNGQRADKSWHAPLLALLRELPSDVIAIESSRQNLWLYWRERGGPERVDQVAAILARLREIGLEH